MEGPIVPPEHLHLLAQRAVEEERGLPPQPVHDRFHARLIFAVIVVLGAIASVTAVVLSLL
jgi:hypothetical protein